MTQIRAAHIGHYPRIGDQKDQQRHRRGLSHFLKKDISAHAFRDVVQSVAQETVHELTEFGLDEITDGLISWPDPISYPALKWTGLATGALRQYFDTSFHHRMLVITGKPKKKDSLLWEDFRFAKSVSSKPVRAILTGPLTLASHATSSSKTFAKLESRVSLFADILEFEIATLVKEGASVIQIDEPSLLHHPSGKINLSKVFAKFKTAAGSAHLIASASFYSESPSFDPLIQLPVDGVQVNVAGDLKNNLARLEPAASKTSIGLGLINAQTTRVDLLDPILNLLAPWIERVKPCLLYVTPSTGLEFLPRDNAQAKIRAVVRLKNDLLKKFSSESVRV